MLKKEYPRPQFRREQWQNLNGQWEFAFDDENKGIMERWYDLGWKLGRTIQVPFVYQCELSGVQERGAHDIVWYKRKFKWEQGQAADTVLLHFEAVDFEANVYINGQYAGGHTGGYTPFTVDITPFLLETAQEQEITVRVYDPHNEERIPRGKQFWEDTPRGIWYTGSTGIWQSVWMEYVPQKRLEDVRFTSQFEEGKELVTCIGTGISDGDMLRYQISLMGKSIAAGTLAWMGDTLDFSVDVIGGHIFHTNFHEPGLAWTPENPVLFDVILELLDAEGRVIDKVNSYFGFRKIHTENGMVYLNNKPYYQKLVLDQGYWEKSLLTAPDDEALIKDIKAAKEMGFNGCRKHQKVEEARFLYWADKLGFLVWGECGSAAMYDAGMVNQTLKDWGEIVKRDYNHPCIVVWVPINESWGVPDIHRNRMQQNFSETMYHYLHSIDDTRLVVSNDGWEMTVTDICAIHNYSHGQSKESKEYEKYRKVLSDRNTLLSNPPTGWELYASGYHYRNEPILLTEFGGIGYAPFQALGWGYSSVSSEAEFIEEYARILDAVYASEGLWGFCYTQLTDVEQEINGLMTYDRRPKCDFSAIRKINERYHLNRLAL